jgi:hypothetical protein
LLAGFSIEVQRTASSISRSRSLGGRGRVAQRLSNVAGALDREGACCNGMKPAWTVASRRPCLGHPIDIPQTIDYNRLLLTKSIYETLSTETF